ncbi:MAG: exodeoxyribonuclease III [Solirubrobacteraceae bacterium]
MRIVTWNVNSLRARLPRVLELLDQQRPDVVCLQETKCAPEDFCVQELERAGYHSVHHSAGPWAGVAILAREPLTDPVAGLPGESRADEARWVEATVAGLRVCCAYVTNGREVGSEWFDAKLTFLDAVADRARQLRDTPMILAGDFNVTREDRDVYDPAAFVGSTHVTAQERERLERIIDAADLRDAYRFLHPDAQQFTWWDYRMGAFHRGLGLRIDYVLLSRRLADGLEQCGIERDFRKGSKPSDHAPLAAVLRPGPVD